MSDLTPEQAAQRLLSLIETLGIHGNDNKTQNAKSRARKLDPSSISWAFHDSVDRSGVLKWIVENVDVSKNGITDDELELLDYLDRINYTSSSDSTSGGLGGELNQGAAADKVVYAFELKARKSALEARIDRLSKYKDVIRGQNAMLKDRVDDMSRKLAAYKAEEENLARLASASDSEVSRLTSIYAGVLEEASLAAKALMAKLDATSGSPSKAVHKNGIATKDEEARQFFYQNSGMVERLGINVQSYMENLSELVMAQIQQSNELPSPWKEFQPFETGSIAELLNLAKSEHGRIDRDVVSLAKTKASLEVQSDLVQAVTQEVDRIYEAGDLLSRCQLLTSSLTNDSTVSHSIDELAEAHARSLTEGALGNFSSASQLEQFKDALDKVNQGFNELAEHRNSQVAQSLIAATQNLEPQHQAAEAILDALAEEQQMLSGWNELWAAVADSLEKDNAETEGQRQALGMRDSLGELKAQAGAMRKRVTRAAMLPIMKLAIVLASAIVAVSAKKCIPRPTSITPTVTPTSTPPVHGSSSSTSDSSPTTCFSTLTSTTKAPISGGSSDSSPTTCFSTPTSTITFTPTVITEGPNFPGWSHSSSTTLTTFTPTVITEGPNFPGWPRSSSTTPYLPSFAASPIPK
ncbi:hypothetical protein GGI12_002868 [Dipsacomyces acuminosporus]|nr:hypothetical protein GGI12_002868 [Dipsacomyces acuminosporus]